MKYLINLIFLRQTATNQTRLANKRTPVTMPIPFVKMCAVKISLEMLYCCSTKNHEEIAKISQKSAQKRNLIEKTFHYLFSVLKGFSAAIIYLCQQPAQQWKLWYKSFRHNGGQISRRRKKNFTTFPLSIRRFNAFLHFFPSTFYSFTSLCDAKFVIESHDFRMLINLVNFTIFEGKFAVIQFSYWFIWIFSRCVSS